ncbi:TrbI/VirB10 family protein [Metapseudomonas furukawaii]|uniref:Conjugative transfer protein n=1 Tax=Metapseudomonas furukawaii TaxID=1149133 RepID=A0AAD1C610_METFU|nr:TrbI/VirB10 family protein [Pseudomonas furukawaii]ELS26298.1 Conjugative transfer protein TrbI [Pseudomonas furukawaii]BAU77408.1 conjugative transfer protein [Pseudomonas furukawaii]
MSLLSADKSPNGLVTGVRKANRLPLFILATAIGVIALVLAMVAMNRAERAAQIETGADSTGEQKPATPVTSSTAADLAKRYGATGVIEPIAEEEEELVEDTGELTPPAEKPAAPQKKKEAPVPVASDTNPQGRPLEYQQQLENFNTTKGRLFEAALTSKSRIEIPTANTMPTTAEGGPLSANEQLEQLRLRAANGGGPASYADRAAEVARIQQMRASGGAEAPSDMGGMGGMGDADSERGGSGFNPTSTEDTWLLQDRLQAPLTPYVVRTGFVIPGIMVGGINSDLPGQIKAQVAQNVYDTATGKFCLIPQGSILVGVYDSNIVFGQERVPVAWQRIIYPDGRALNISGMPGADSAGYSGLHDLTDHHLARIFGAAFAMSVISAGFTLSQDDSSGGTDDRPDASSAMSEALGQNLGQTATQMIQKNLAIQPTNIIRPGMRFNVMVSKDIVFDAPYVAFQY